MRAVLVMALLARRAEAEPEAAVREEVTRDGASIDLDAPSLRMRTEGSAVGVGVSTNLVRGDYALSLGLTRWQTIDQGSGSQGSWEVALRGTRYFQIGAKTRAYVTAGANIERVERDDSKLVRRGFKVGAGIEWEHGWVELAAEYKTWLDMPTGVRDADELTIMLMLGFTF
ncbi:MAG: porin family protein [Myxococcota bacterium]|nr:porin family protein [Myxococcota bacterium]